MNYVKDLWTNGTMLSQEQIVQLTGDYPGLTFENNAIISAIPQAWQSQMHNYAERSEPKKETNIEEGSINMLSNKRLRETIARQSNKEICAVNFWKHKFDVDIENYFSIATKESRLRLLQSKFIHNI